MMMRSVLPLLCIFFVIVCSAYCSKIIANKALFDMKDYEENKEYSFIIGIKNKQDIDVKTLSKNVDPMERPRFVSESLRNAAIESQEEIISFLEKNQIKYRKYWLVNMITITTNISTIRDFLIPRNDIRYVEPNNEFKVHLEKPDTIEEEPPSPLAIEWNVEWVGADKVWEKGINGEGFVVANADTGVAWNHPALRSKYRGTIENPENPSHDYNWWDAVHQPNTQCGSESKEPCDDNGHGTHTTGTSVGDDGQGNQIGVAPGASWIGCRNMRSGVGTPTRYIECLEFFVAPTDLNGEDPKPELAPHVISNSYGCPQSEGCSSYSLEEAVGHVRAAGIVMSVSAGNSGSSCNTVSDPPAIYPNVFTVGATGYRTNTIASYSSRGPVTVLPPGSHIKPNIVAPGSSVRSAYPPSGYATFSGTSMSAPNVAGCVALLYQGDSSMVREVERTERALEESAIRLDSSTCGGDEGFNNVYGRGAIDIDEAISSTNKIN